MCVYCRSRGSIAGILSGLRAGQSEVQIPAGAREFSLHVYSMGAGVSFTGRGVNRPGRHADHCLPPSAKFKNE